MFTTERLFVIGVLLFIFSAIIIGYYFFLNMFVGGKTKFKISFSYYLQILRGVTKVETYYKALMFASLQKDDITPKDLFYFNRFDVDFLKGILQGSGKLKKAGIKVTIKDVLNYELKGGNIIEIIPFIIKANNIGIAINLNDLTFVRMSGGKPDEVIGMIIKSKAFGHELTINIIKKHLDNAGDFSDLIHYLKFLEEGIKIKQKNTEGEDGFIITDMSLELMRKYRATRNDIDKLYKILQKLDNNSILIDFDELLLYPNDLDIYEAIDIFIKLEHIGENIHLKEIYKHLSSRSNYKELIDIKLKSKMSGVEISLSDMRAYPIDGNLKEAVDLYIKAKKQNVEIEFSDLKSFHLAGGNISKLVAALIKSEHENLNIDDKNLKQYFSLGGELETAINLLIKVKKVSSDVELKDLIDFQLQGGKINNLITAIIKSEQEELGLSKNDLMSYFRAGGNVLNLTEAFKITKLQNIDIPKEKLLALQKTGTNVLSYIKALRFNKREGLNIDHDILEAHIKEGIDIFSVLYAMYNLRNSGVQGDYGYLVALSRAGKQVDEEVKNALIPKTFKIEAIEIVSQDGILISVGANITVLRKNITQIFGGAQEDEIVMRIEEALITEVMKCKTHKEVVESRNTIAENTLEVVENQKDLNQNSAVKVIDISIPDITLLRDINTDLIKTIAKEQKDIDEIDAERRKLLIDVSEKEAQIKLINEKAEKEKNIGIAFKDGTIQTKEYYKYKSNEK
jgi:uncharacterized protein YqfA (UPF0365 family)